MGRPGRSLGRANRHGSEGRRGFLPERNRERSLTRSQEYLGSGKGIAFILDRAGAANNSGGEGKTTEACRSGTPRVYRKRPSVSAGSGVFHVEGNLVRLLRGDAVRLRQPAPQI